MSTFCSWFTLQLNKWRTKEFRQIQTNTVMYMRYLHKWGHYLKVVFNYCCGRYSRTLLRHPHAFDFAFVFVVLFVFVSLVAIFLLLLYYYVFCVVLFYFFFWQITLINYFYQSGKWGQWQPPALVPISPICLGLVCQLTIRFFSRAHSLVPLPCLCLSSLLFYAILFCM